MGVPKRPSPDAAAPAGATAGTAGSHTPEFEVLQGLQALQDAMDHMHSSMRQAMELNATDIRAIRMLSVRQMRGEHVTPQHLTQHLGITTAATTTVIDRLISHGYVTRTAHPHDGRSRILELTTEARKTFQHHFSPHLHTMRTAMSDFTAEELRAAARLMNHMAQQLETQINA